MDRPPERHRIYGTGYLVLYGCFFLSGAAALVYEICWIRAAGLAYGSSSRGLAAVLAVFFLGLALGSALFGRAAARIRRPLVAYALLEVGTAAVAAPSLFLLRWIEPVYGLCYRAHIEESTPLWMLRLGLLAIAILPATFLMGGTFPLFCRQLVSSGSRVTATVGLLYGVNTIGAAIGAAVTGLWLLPRLGMQALVFLGALLNVTAALSAIAVRLPPPAVARTEPALPSPRRRVWIQVGALFFLGGFSALGFQVILGRFLALVTRSTLVAATITLVVVLLGIVLGSAVAARYGDRSIPRARVLGGLYATSAIAVAALLARPASFWSGLQDGIWVHVFLFLPIAALSGAAFPLGVRLVVDRPDQAGAGAGFLTAINTLGGILGSLATGFLLLPALGLEGSLRAVSGAALVAGIAAWAFLDRQGKRSLRAALAFLAVAIWAGIPLLSETRVPRDLLAESGDLLAWREGREGNLAVVRRDDMRHLEIDRWWQGSDRKSHQVLAAHVPMLLHPGARRVLVVGVGVGQTSSRFLMHDVEELVGIDVEGGLFPLVRSHFPSQWMDDPRVRLLVTDGRDYVRHASEVYDVISLELGQLFRPGVGAFYTIEFYERARSRLAPGGVLTQFVPLPFLDVETFRSVLLTFLQVFPEAALWYNTSELLLLGWNAPGKADGTGFDRVATDAALREDLDFSLWGGLPYRLRDPDVLLAGFLAGPRGLDRLAGGGTILRDDRPTLDYAVRDTHRRAPRDSLILVELRSALDPPGALFVSSLDPEREARILGLREKNIADLAADVWIRQVDGTMLRTRPDEAGSILARALEENPENVTAHRLLGETAIFQGRFDLARERLAWVLEREPRDAGANRGLAFLLHRSGSVLEAIPLYRNALLASPEDAETQGNLGAALAETGDLEGARSHLEEALRLDPANSGARQNLARVRSALGS